jgi:hypothetical protein
MQRNVITGRQAQMAEKEAIKQRHAEEQMYYASLLEQEKQEKLEKGIVYNSALSPTHPHTHTPHTHPPTHPTHTHTPPTRQHAHKPTHPHTHTSAHPHAPHSHAPPTLTRPTHTHTYAPPLSLTLTLTLKFHPSAFFDKHKKGFNKKKRDRQKKT